MPSNFNPRTPDGVRPDSESLIDDPYRISIHAPLTGCDFISFVAIVKIRISIHAPLTGCDEHRRVAVKKRLEISIHAPLTGCDQHIYAIGSPSMNFNPRTPDGVRPLILEQDEQLGKYFNPRTPDGVRRVDQA